MIQHVLNSPENVDKCLNETETSLYELLYQDPMDYTGEHLVEAFRFTPLLKSSNEYIKLYNSNNGINLEEHVKELQKQRTQARRRRMDVEKKNNSSNDEAAAAARGAVIENMKAYVAAIVATIESKDEESWTMFQDETMCSMTTTITQQAQKEQAQAQEDSNSITIIKKKKKNIFNELITYYNGGSDLRQQKTNEYFS